MTVVCVDCRYIGPKPSGIGEVTWGLARHLPALAPDLQFLFLRNAERGQPLNPSANVTEVIVKAPANSPQTLWWLPRLVDLKDVDLFHAPFNILPSGLTMKTLTTVHDIMWLTNPNWCNPGPYGHIERRFYAHGIRRALGHSDKIAAVSAATKADILRESPGTSGKVSVTLSGVSDQFTKTPVQEETLRAIGLAPKQKFVLTAGQFAPYKNHEGAIKAFAKAFDKDESISLVMVQRRNAGADKLRALAQSLGIAHRVHFTGPVSFSALLQLYSGALALLHPSFCEGFGNPVAEAMACGCPVVTSNISAMPEVTGGVTGGFESGAALLVDPRDTSDIARALRMIATDDALSDQLRSKGRARASELSWERFAKDNLAIYRELLTSP